MNDEARRAHALAIYRAAVRAADPRALVERALASFDAPRVVLIAIGKAALPMAEGALAALGPRVARGVAVTNDPRALGDLVVIRGDHPVPGPGSLSAGDALLRAAHAARRGGTLVALISGGASALAESPLAPLTLEDLARTNALLLASGAPVEAMNVVRKHLSAIKGGRLAAEARPARIVTIVLSDVVGGVAADVGSGPTVSDPSTLVDARDVLARYLPRADVPERVRALLSDGRTLETPKPGDRAFAADETHVIGDASIAARAAVREAELLGYRARVHTAGLRGDAREAGAMVAALARAARAEAPICLVLAGETTVEVRGKGRGGRAQTLALTAALALAGEPGITIAALATDGIDGPTDAAGAIVDGTTASSATANGVDSVAALADDDAYSALDASGALVRTGPSGTNVNDLILVLVDH